MRQSIPSDTLTLRVSAQHTVQYTDVQRSILFLSRRKYITDMAYVARRRQGLLQQLQSSSGSLCLSFTESGSRYHSVEHITQQLQECVTQEDQVFRQYFWGPYSVVRVGLQPSSYLSLHCSVKLGAVHDSHMSLQGAFVLWRICVVAHCVVAQMLLEHVQPKAASHYIRELL